MESVLHIEPIIRRTTAPLSIGHTDYIWYGEKNIGEDDDPMGTFAASTRLGCPLEEVDHGSTRSHVPLVKTIEYMPDFHRNAGHVYIETVHYFKDMKYLIPVRTKIHSGFSQGLRIAHLPSLNYARQELGGLGWSVCDSRSEIVTELLNNDAYFENRSNHPVMDWIRDDLTNILSTSTITDIRFDTDRLDRMIHRYRQQVQATPHEMSAHHLKDILSIISLENETFPTEYISQDVIARPIWDVKRRLQPHTLDLASRGRIPVEKLPRIEYNPFYFQPVLGLIDRSPLTDFNIDVIIQADNSISFIHDHVATNRLSAFVDNDLGAFTTETLISDLVNEETLRGILKRFLKYHTGIDEEIRSILCTQPVKMKLMKTIADEALILLYKHNSSSADDPLCGVYFDIALQSLAPLTIIPEINLT